MSTWRWVGTGLGVGEGRSAGGESASGERQEVPRGKDLEHAGVLEGEGLPHAPRTELGDAGAAAAASQPVPPCSSSSSSQSYSLASSPSLWQPVPWHPSLPSSTTGWKSTWMSRSSSVTTGGQWPSEHRALASGSPSWRPSLTWLSPATYAGQAGGEGGRGIFTAVRR